MDDSLTVDAFIPWVDSNDPAWQAKYACHKASGHGGGFFPNATSATRFHDVGELNRCLQSMEKNAPWFHNIFILTDDQSPNLRDVAEVTRNKIRLVTHKQMFGEFSYVLPTFNSRTLDCMVWNLNGLAEHFVYFNDDFFISRPVSKSDFFDGDRVVVRGHWSAMRRSLISRLRRKLTGSGERTTGFGEGQRRSAEMLDFRGKFFKFNHAPRAVVKSRMKSVFESFREDVERNISFRFRHADQFVFFALYYHAELLNRMVAFGSPDSTVNIKGSLSFDAEFSRLQESLADPDVKFLCLQSLDLFTQDQIAEVLKQLDRHLALDQAPPAAGA